MAVPRAVPFSLSLPRPGRPATALTDDDPVGAMQNIDARVGCDTSSTGVSAIPWAVIVPSCVAGLSSRSKRHSRRLTVQVCRPGAQLPQVPPSPGGRQSAFDVQLRKVSTEHRLSLGASWHWPSSEPAAADALTVAARVRLGRLAGPAAGPDRPAGAGRLGAARRIAAGAFELHGDAGRRRVDEAAQAAADAADRSPHSTRTASTPASSQVSHGHLNPVNPNAVQFGLADDSDRLSAPGRVPQRDRQVRDLASRESGGQSRLVRPKAGIGDSEFASHAMPARGPSVQVPPRHAVVDAAGVGALRTRLVGREHAGEDVRRQVSTLALSPVSMFAVPVMVPMISLVTQVATPPAESGSGAPNQ